MDSKSWVKERLRARQNPNYGYLNITPELLSSHHRLHSSN